MCFARVSASHVSECLQRSLQIDTVMVQYSTQVMFSEEGSKVRSGFHNNSTTISKNIMDWRAEGRMVAQRQWPSACALLLVLCWSAAPARSVPVPDPEPGLLRVPRVYNALITTDERLLPSRAVSVSAPLLPGAPLIIGPAPAPAIAASALSLAPASAPAATRGAAPPAPPAPQAPAAAAPARSAPAKIESAAAPASSVEDKEVEGNPTAPSPAPAAPEAKGREAARPLSPTLYNLYNPYLTYSSYSFPSLLPYSLTPHHTSPFLFYHSPFLPSLTAPSFAPVFTPAEPAPAGPPVPAAPEPAAADPSGRALPAGAKDEPDKDAISVEAN